MPLLLTVLVTYSRTHCTGQGRKGMRFGGPDAAARDNVAPDAAIPVLQAVARDASDGLLKHESYRRSVGQPKSSASQAPAVSPPALFQRVPSLPSLALAAA